MAVDIPKKTQAELEQEQHARETRQANERKAAQGLNGLGFFNGSGGGLMGLLAAVFMMLGGGKGGLFSGLGAGLGNVGRSISTGVSDFTDGISGRGDTPLAPKGAKQDHGFANSVGTTLRAGWEGVLDLIGKHESGGDYNRVYGPGVKRVDLTDMTIDQVQEWQRKYVNSGSPSSAVGKYQIVSKTLAGLEKQMGLTGKEKFDAAMQDRMALQLLQNRGIGKLKAETMTTGQINRAINAISREWASIEGANGRGAYDGDGLNRAAKGSGAKMALALQAAVNGEELRHASIVHKRDAETVVASNETHDVGPSKTPSAAAEMAKAAAPEKAAPNDPVADRKIVKVASGMPVFVGSYGEGPTTLASVTPEPHVNRNIASGVNPKA